jgi:hypothetical protein
LKQLTAISLLAIHLFNIVGYTLAFSIAEGKANEQMIASLDNNNYNENDLVELKLAINVPYIQGTGSYERYDGQIELNGVHYNYVKRIVKNDTLYLYCIPNTQKTNLSRTKNLYAEQNADNSSNKTSEHSLSKQINFFNDYYSDALSFNFNVFQSSTAQKISFSNLTILKGFPTKHLQPPDLFI